MPRTKKKYNERIELGIGPDGKRIRKWIQADTEAVLKRVFWYADQIILNSSNPEYVGVYHPAE